MVSVSKLRRRLLDSVRGGSIAEVEAALEAHPGVVNAADSHGNTVLGKAVQGKSVEVVELLLRHGADPCQANQAGFTPLDAAIRSGNAQILACLRAHAVPLSGHQAAALGEVDILRQRIEAGELALGAVDPRGGTLLHAAASGSQPEVAELLIELCCAIDAVNRHGIGALGEAVEAKSVEVARLLLEKGADPNSQGGHSGGTVLHRAIALRSRAMAKLLLESGSDPNRQDAGGKSALHQAVGEGQLELLELVLRFGADPSLRTRESPRNPHSETALEMADRQGKRGCVNLLHRGEST